MSEVKRVKITGMHGVAELKFTIPNPEEWDSFQRPEEKMWAVSDEDKSWIILACKHITGFNRYDRKRLDDTFKLMDFVNE